MMASLSHLEEPFFLNTKSIACIAKQRSIQRSSEDYMQGLHAICISHHIRFTLFSSGRLATKRLEVSNPAW